MERRDVIICGDGGSAVALAHALAKHADRRLAVTIVGAGRSPGEGVAYATRNPAHLLNAPAAKMSADADEPGQFVQWLKRRGRAPAGWTDGFVPRSLYAGYLADLVERCRASPAGRIALDVVRSDLIGLGRQHDSWTVFHKGGVLSADAVVLATGNDMPESLANRFGAAVSPYVIEDPWQDIDVAPDAHILTLGSGLTAIDTALTLLDRNHRGAITLLSRRGLLPHAHVEPCDVPEPPALFARTALGHLRALRAALGRDPDAATWQGLVDSLRPRWPEIWQALPLAEKRRFLRHGFSLFNIHRHRMAPRAGARIADAVARGAIRIARGKVGAMRVEGGALHVTAHHGGGTHELTTDRLVNCTGPNSDPEKSHDTFIQTVIAAGIARSGTLGIGLDVDATDRVLDTSGEPQRGLFAMGALTKGRWWEITAMPEIAQQAKRITHALLARYAAERPHPSEYAGGNTAAGQLQPIGD